MSCAGGRRLFYKFRRRKSGGQERPGQKRDPSVTNRKRGMFCASRDQRACLGIFAHQAGAGRKKRQKGKTLKKEREMEGDLSQKRPLMGETGKLKARRETEKNSP